MAIGGIIGSIRVALGLDTAQFQNGAKEMQGTLGSIASSLKGFAAGLGAALSLGALVKVMQSAIDHADELGKTAQKIGLPVEALSALEYSARLADVELEQLTLGVGKLSQALAAAAGGTSNDATKALAAIGVAATDAQGKLRPTNDVIFDVADAFRHMEDGAGKTALAMAIFGRSGKDLIPLLNAGAAGLKLNADEAARFGIIIDTKTAKAAEAFNDNLTRLKTAMEGLANKAMVALIDKFVQLTDAMVALAKSDAVSSFFTELDNRISTTIKEFQALVNSVKTVSAVFGVLTSEGSSEFGKMHDIVEAIDKTWKDVGVTSKENIDILNSMDIGKPTIQPKIEAPVVKAPDTEGIKAQAKAMREALQVFDQTTNSVQKYAEDLKQLDFLLKNNTITQQQYNEHVKQLKENFAETTPVVNELGASIKETIQGSLSGIFDDAISGTFKFKDAIGDLLASLTKLTLNNALQLLLNPPTNPSQGGGLGGFFSNLLGFAKGGTIFPGSGGGQDSQVVAFRKSPNERVDITKPGQSLSAGGVVIENKIINYSSAKVETGQDNLGNPITIIRDQVRNTIRGGGADSEMAQRFGQVPMKQRRI